ncbi:MAG TPA: class I SAM-dependent methyltransferase [Gemmatales bacterium]|nr:class I SAM-dependent methyltransferase [Gemmatales bacterium]
MQQEKIFHEAQAAQRQLHWKMNPDHLLMQDENYLDHEPWVRPALALLGELRGKRILDFGCGHGMASTLLARSGADVFAMDLSANFVHEAVTRALVNSTNVQGFVADGCRIPLRDHCLDGIWGVAILHHLHVVKAAQEIKRVLKPGGTAVFCEPWGGNPFLEWGRRNVPYVGKERTPDEKPLQEQDLLQLRNFFSNMQVKHVQLLGMLRRLWRKMPGLSLLDRWDYALLRHHPSLRTWCRYVVICLNNDWHQRSNSMN